MAPQDDRPTVLSVGGFDPSGGAGVLADCKTFEALRVRGMAVLIANTIQTEDTLSYLDWFAVGLVRQGIYELMERYTIGVVKIGIVKDLAFLKAIVESILQCNPAAKIIWDPVLKSTSGYTFFEERDLYFLPDIAKQLQLVTPNFDEYQVLEPYFRGSDACAVLLKGGHREAYPGVDSLLWQARVIHFPPSAATVYPKHGSGCVLSSAIAANMARGAGLEEACRRAKVYTERFLNSHPSLLGYHEDTA